MSDLLLCSNSGLSARTLVSHITDHEYSLGPCCEREKRSEAHWELDN